MTETLTRARFRELADSYGGIVARWPARHRDDAMRMASQAGARAILAQASALDEALDAWVVAIPSDALRESVVRGAQSSIGGVAARARLWWSGIGIAAALAGAAAGTAAVAVARPIEASSDGGTSFGDIGAQES